MTQLRYLIIAMCTWLFLLYNIERLAAPINIASFVYVFVIGCALLLLISPQLSKLSLHWIFAIILPPYFLLKQLFDLEIGGGNLPLTVTELSAVALATVLARRISLQLDEWRKVITSLTIGQFKDDLQPFDTGQAQIYREIRRARRHHRAAALLAVSAPEMSAESTQERLQETPLYRFIEEIQRETLEKYVSARLADLLVNELGDLAIVTHRNNHFITLLPETDRAELDEVIRKLELAAKEKLGIQLKVGVSTFPDEAVTFETMLEHAELEMVNDKLPVAKWIEAPKTEISNGVCP